jgi:hypothetical protein
MTLILAPRAPSRQTATDEPSAGSLRAWLGQLANSATLSPFAPLTLPVVQSRAPAEYHAAARAAACPDLFVIHAPDPASRERIAADLVAAAHNDRALVLSTEAVTADRIVERLLKAQVSAVRALAEDENPLRPSPPVARATSSALISAKLERLKREVAAEVAATAGRLEAVVAAITATEQLAALTLRCGAIDAQMADLRTQRARIEPQVRLEAAGADSSPFSVRLAQHSTEGQSAVGLIQQKHQSALAQHRDKESLVVELRKQTSGVEATKKSGFFTRFLGKHKPVHDAGELGKQLNAAEQELHDVAATVEALQHEFEAAAAKLSEERRQLIEAEIAVRQADFDVQLLELMNEKNRLGAQIEAAHRTLGAHPASAEELAAARRAAECELSAARERAAEVERSASAAASAALEGIRVAVGTPGSLAADPVFDRGRTSTSLEPPFDLLVLDHAEELTEADFLRLARLGRRWVLIGDIAFPEEHRPHPKGLSSRNGQGFGRNGRAPEAPFATRMAQLLDHEKWGLEPDRLICRLARLSPEERRRITREPVVNRPEIELRIAPQGEPVLAEVAFPVAIGIAEAKSFLYQELGEVLLRPCGEVAWSATPEAIVAAWPAADHGPGESAWIELEAGVREKVVGSGLGAFTASIAFDVAAGWTVESAAHWLQDHLPAESIGRFAAVLRR